MEPQGHQGHQGHEDHHSSIGISATLHVPGLLLAHAHSIAASQVPSDNLENNTKGA